MSDPTYDARQRRNHNDQDVLHAADAADGDAASIAAIDKDSPGVRRIDAIVSVWNKTDRVYFIAALMLMTYGRSLAAQVMGTYQSIALNEFGEAAKSGMVRTVRQVLTATTLPITAKLSDYVGRTFSLSACAIFWIIGPALVASSTSLGSYLPGFLIYTLGHVFGNILNYALSIDTTTLRNRLFMQLVFIFPSIINLWASGVIAARMETITWRWGAGMWSIIAPVSTVGVIAVFGWSSLRARRMGLLKNIPSAWGLFTTPSRWVHLFWVMDVPGLTLLAGALALILLPLSLGGGVSAKWVTAPVLTPLFIGVALFPAFAIWEWKWARHPIFPFRCMKDKHVMLILLMSFIKNIASSTRDSYLYYTLMIAFNQETEGATRINNIDSFAGALTIIPVAFLVRRFRCIKPFIVCGTILICVAQGMLVYFRGGYGKGQLAGLIIGEMLDGIGTGMSNHPSVVAMQAKLSHEHALLVTSCWAVGSQAGGGVAAAISGALWTNLMPGKLRTALQKAGVADAAKVAQQAMRKPIDFKRAYAPFTPERDAVSGAYRDMQRILCIIGVCLAATLIPMAFLIDNVTIDDRTTLAKDTASDTSEETRHPDSPTTGSDPVDNKDQYDNKAMLQQEQYEEQSGLGATNRV